MGKPLVIVYHREPYEEHVVDGQVVLKENQSPNGIVPALKGFFGNVERATWVAWKKSPAGKRPSFPRRITVEDSYGTYQVARLPLDANQIRQFYHITSKEALWPVIHSLPYAFSTEHTDWATFQEVNRRFAEAAAEEAAADSVVWVHDYNLWLVPKYLRAMRPDVKIAFFHHTPFPSPDIFCILPWRNEILESLLACDLVGFHVARYARNFSALVEALRQQAQVESAPVPMHLRHEGIALSEDITPVSVTVGGHVTLIDATPIGTHPELIRQIVSSEEGQARVQAIREDLKEDIIIVSINRVDYTKGVHQMLEAFDRLLTRRPELHGRIKLILTAVAPADGIRIYRSAQQQIEQTVGRINGYYGTLTWLPIVLSTQSMPFEEVLSCYRAADICWVTPLRDGLNLVAKEFVAANEDGDGVLVLSEFAGVAVELQGAVLTNPYSRNSMDKAIDEAIDMPRAERQRRMQYMCEQVQRFDIRRWTDHVLNLFDKISEDPASKTA
ncbi:MAG TPA: glucosylglycerol-phosphate synthase [Acidiferrobacter sp.]|nr:glucosylglycerol-phosphate synthase [Acidiferrobacter sp.]